MGSLKHSQLGTDSGPGIAGWSGDGKRIYFSEAKGTGTQIYAVNIAANTIEEIKTTAAVCTLRL